MKNYKDAYVFIQAFGVSFLIWGLMWLSTGLLQAVMASSGKIQLFFAGFVYVVVLVTLIEKENHLE